MSEDKLTVTTGDLTVVPAPYGIGYWIAKSPEDAAVPVSGESIDCLRIIWQRYRCPVCGAEETHPADQHPRCSRCYDNVPTMVQAPFGGDR